MVIHFLTKIKVIENSYDYRYVY